MSVWRNEEDFMTNMDNMLSEFYIKDKKITTKKLNVHKQKQTAKSWYESDSDDESDVTVKCKDAAESSKCPSMEPMDTVQVMKSIRMQVRNVVGNVYNNDVLETYIKAGDESDSTTTPFEQPQVTSTEIKKLTPNSLVNSYKTEVGESIASSSKLNYDDNIDISKNKLYTRGKRIYNNTKTRSGCRGPRYHNIALHSLQNNQNNGSIDYKSKNEFPPL